MASRSRSRRSGPSSRAWASRPAVPALRSAQGRRGVSNPTDTNRTRPGQSPKPPPHWHRVVFIVGSIVVLFGVYQLFTSFAPEVTGWIVAVHVTDNQEVKAGDRLLSIDPEPFALIVNQRQAEHAEAKALVLTAQDELATRAGGARAGDIGGHLFGPDAAPDGRPGPHQQRAACRAGQGRAALDRTAAALATAQLPLIGIVDAASWGIAANYKQSNVRSFAVGAAAWVRLQRRIPVTLFLADPPPG